MRWAPVVVRIGEFEDFKKDLMDAVGKGPQGFNVVYLRPSQFPTLFSEQRIRLLKAMQAHPDFGVVKLAKLLERKQEAVSRDISHLKFLGILKEEKSADEQPGLSPVPLSLSMEL